MADFLKNMYNKINLRKFFKKCLYKQNANIISDYGTCKQIIDVA